MKFKAVLMLLFITVITGCNLLEKADGIPFNKGRRFYTVKTKRISLHTTQKALGEYSMDERAGFKIELLEPLISNSGIKINEVLMPLRIAPEWIVFLAINNENKEYTLTLDGLHTKDKGKTFLTYRISEIK